MWRMLQHDTADDFVLATGETHTIREFVELSFAELGITIEWQGKGVDEKGIVASLDNIKLEKLSQTLLSERLTLNTDSLLNSVVVSVSSNYFRPTEVACSFGKLLIGNPTKAKEKLEWEAKVDLPELVAKMVKSDLL